MKKILSFLAIGLVSFGIFWGGKVFAGGPTDTTTATTTTTIPQQPTEVIVTEQIPGMKCGLNIASGTGCTGVQKDSPECRKYKCEIQPGFQSVMLMLAGFIKYATFIVALLGVLMLVYSGIEMSLSGLGGKKDDAKKRIEKVILGLVLLFMIGLILNSVAPWIYQ